MNLNLHGSRPPASYCSFTLPASANNHMSCSRPPLASGISGTLKLEVVTSKVLVTTMSWLTVTMTTDVLICSVCRNHSPVLDVFSYSQISFNSRTLPTIYSEFEKAEFPLLGILKDIKRNGHPSPKQQINQENIQHGQ